MVSVRERVRLVVEVNRREAPAFIISRAWGPAGKSVVPGKELPGPEGTDRGPGGALPCDADGGPERCKAFPLSSGCPNEARR